MPSNMLIDATHPEETRVVVKRGIRVEEFDFEAEAKRQLRGNIYLAKVTRVEPSLQAAFVDYGGNRHGFLAFSEIHPDYYQIPQADRDALLATEREESVSSDDVADDANRVEEVEATGENQAVAEDVDASAAPSAEEPEAETADDAVVADAETGETNSDEDAPVDAQADVEEIVETDDSVDESGSDDALDEAAPQRRINRRNYKIQEVIKRRQILLVQVVKEERGNKGAALTTYLSLAGRYAVLMPNTPRGGGISRKITSAADRKRLKEVVSKLDVPDGMGVILRTAGANRTKVEIKRDFEYMMRLWETVRELTLKSTAPMLVYEEGSLIKRSIRDLYSRDIDNVLVAGEEGYREAKDFMRMLMPSHAKNVQMYKDATPLFTAHGVEEQLDTMFEPTVRLKSGGYLVINQTEALVAIDVNSGKSTREHNIEDTAVQTNLEAADEIARQLRLRDLAGLVVCDFIDMEEKRNNRAVEKRMKDALKSDRARIQVGRISHFGLLEMSRQRLRTSLMESTTETCPHCGGSGLVRSASSVALQVIRQAEAQLLKSPNHHALIKVHTDVALYILNQKRHMVADIETRYGRRIAFDADPNLTADTASVSAGPPATAAEIEATPPLAPIGIADDVDEIEEDTEVQSESTDAQSREGAAEENGEGRKKRRRRRRRKSSDREESQAEGSSEGTTDEEAVAADAESITAEDSGDEEPKRRRRSRRGGGRRRRGRADNGAESAADDDAVSQPEMADGGSPEKSVESDAPVAAKDVGEDSNEEPNPQNGSDVRASDSVVPEDETPAEPELEPEPVLESSSSSPTPKKQGWWQRRSFF
ncbi:MAG: Rne/Rng family ribonuclease [Pseudomonadota bacterium]